MAEQTVPPLVREGAMRTWFQALTSTRGYDLAIRACFLCYILFLALPNAVGVAARVRVQSGTWDLALLADILARTGVLLFFVLVALLVLVRTRPLRKAQGLQPRLSALAGSCLLLSMAAPRSLDRPQSAVRRPHFPRSHTRGLRAGLARTILQHHG
jgi:hypothetical protein